MSHFFSKKVLDFGFCVLYSMRTIEKNRCDMKDETVKRESYWVVEAIDKSGKTVYNGTFLDFTKAWNKYYSFKNKNTVSLQRKFKETKIAV